MAQLKSNSRIYGNLRVDGRFLDSSGDAGTSGQILSSTGTGTDWITAGAGGGATVQYFSAAGPATNQTLTATLATVVLNTTIASSGTGDFTIASGVVTFVQSGVYHVSYSILTDIAAGNTSRSESEAFLRINGTGELNHSQVIMFNREGTEGAATGAKSMLYSATANDTIQIVARRSAGTNTILVLQDQCVLTIYRVS